MVPIQKEHTTSLGVKRAKALGPRVQGAGSYDQP